MTNSSRILSVVAVCVSFGSLVPHHALRGQALEEPTDVVVDRAVPPAEEDAAPPQESASALITTTRAPPYSTGINDVQFVAINNNAQAGAIKVLYNLGNKIQPKATVTTAVTLVKIGFPPKVFNLAPVQQDRLVLGQAAVRVAVPLDVPKGTIIANVTLTIQDKSPGSPYTYTYGNNVTIK